MNKESVRTAVIPCGLALHHLLALSDDTVLGKRQMSEPILTWLMFTFVLCNLLVKILKKEFRLKEWIKKSWKEKHRKWMKRSEDLLRHHVHPRVPILILTLTPQGENYSSHLWKYHMKEKLDVTVALLTYVSAGITSQNGMIQVYQMEAGERDREGKNQRTEKNLVRSVWTKSSNMATCWNTPIIASWLFHRPQTWICIYTEHRCLISLFCSFFSFIPSYQRIRINIEYNDNAALHGSAVWTFGIVFSDHLSRRSFRYIYYVTFSITLLRWLLQLLVS